MSIGALSQAQFAGVNYHADYDTEVARTRAGHWHPDTVACTTSCPMGDPRSAQLFHDMLGRASRSLEGRRADI